MKNAEPELTAMLHIIGEGGPNDRAALRLDTRQRNHIQNVQKLDRHPDALSAGVKIIEANYNGAKCVSATALYNCAGLVFGSRRTWIEVEISEWILREDNFERLQSSADWDVGDVVVYRMGNAISHVARIRSIIRPIAWGEIQVIVVSAWGESGEYVHPWKVVSPLLGAPAEVWSQRKAVA